MKQRDMWKFSLLNVFSSPLRSALTVLGMAIGIGAILAVLTLGDAGKTQVRAEMTRLGIDKIWLTAAQGSALQNGDAQLLEDALHTAATEQIYLPAQLLCGEQSDSATIVGCSETYLQLAGASLCRGRMLYPLEWLSTGASALIGCELAQKLQADIGDVLFAQGIPFRICGVLEGAAGFTRVDLAEALVLPAQVLGNLTGHTVHEIMLDVPQGQAPQTVAAMAQRILEASRGMTVETLTMQVQIEAAESVVGIFVEVLKWVAFICILVGGIGVMNILLVSVRERRREIGVMKSLGMSAIQVRLLFLMEALLYAAAGGVLGIAMGAALVELAGRSIGLLTAVRPADCAAVVCVAVGVGLFFGVMPASRAAALCPVDALRSE